jgi:hypothetical protein
MIASGVMLRRHSEPVTTLNNLWWREVEGGSVRDQLAFNHVASGLGLSYHAWPERYWESPRFRYRGHLL